MKARRTTAQYQEELQRLEREIVIAASEFSLSLSTSRIKNDPLVNMIGVDISPEEISRVANEVISSKLRLEKAIIALHVFQEE